MKQGNGGSELLIPAVSAMRIGGGHGFTSKLIVSHSSEPMPQQGGSDLKRNTEILQPGGKGMAEIMEVEVGHLRFHH
ncbi:hypothetical protein ACYX34_08640 [Nitrospira sp. CMX1]